MRVARFARSIVLIAALAGATQAAVDDNPIDKKNWLNEKMWPAFVATQTLEIADKDDALTKLLKERFNAAQAELRSRYVYWLQDAESLPQVYETARRVIEARLGAGGTGSDEISVLKEKVAFAKVVEKQAEGLLDEFKHSRQMSDVESAKYFRADAELELLRAQKKVVDTDKGK